MRGVPRGKVGSASLWAPVASDEKAQVKFLQATEAARCSKGPERECRPLDTSDIGTLSGLRFRCRSFETLGCKQPVLVGKSRPQPVCLDHERKVEALGWSILRNCGEPNRTASDFTCNQMLTSNWLRVASQRIVPRPFGDIATEAEFLKEFRLAGLRSIAYSCLLGIAIYVAFGVFDLVYGLTTASGMVRRLIAISLLGIIVVVVFMQPERVLSAYNLLFGICCFAAMIGSSCFRHTDTA